MTKRYDLVSIGYPSIDYIIKVNGQPSFGKTVIIENKQSKIPYYGGCAVNIVYLLSCLGRSCGISMIVGEDFQSSGFQKFLTNKKISLEFVKTVKGINTSYTNLIMSPDGEHMTLFYPGPMTKEYSNLYDYKGLDTKYGMLTIGELNGNKQFLQTCKDKNIPLVFSMKGDYSSLDYEYLISAFKESELIFMNETEYEQLNRYLPKPVLDYLDKDNKKIIVVTYGKSGSIIYTSRKTIEIPSWSNSKVVDTSGGGDAYIAGFLSEYINKKTLLECGISGTALASFIIEDFGCLSNIPDEKNLKERKNKLKGVVK